MKQNTDSTEKSIIIEMLKFTSFIKIVDIGALMYDNISPNYQPLVDSNIAEVIGFEPNLDEQLKLKASLPNHTYLPYAIGDGTESMFYSTEMPSCSSLLKPNLDILGDFYHFPEWMKVKKESTIKTYRLDDVLKEQDIDFIKLDIQGSELTALENGINTLNSSIIIELEVEFI